MLGNSVPILKQDGNRLNFSSLPGFLDEDKSQRRNLYLFCFVAFQRQMALVQIQTQKYWFWPTNSLNFLVLFLETCQSSICVFTNCWCAVVEVFSSFEKHFCLWNQLLTGVRSIRSAVAPSRMVKERARFTWRLYKLFVMGQQLHRDQFANIVKTPNIKANFNC